MAEMTEVVPKMVVGPPWLRLIPPPSGEEGHAVEELQDITQQYRSLWPHCRSQPVFAGSTVCFLIILSLMNYLMLLNLLLLLRPMLLHLPMDVYNMQLICVFFSYTSLELSWAVKTCVIRLAHNKAVKTIEAKRRWLNESGTSFSVGSPCKFLKGVDLLTFDWGEEGTVKKK